MRALVKAVGHNVPISEKWYLDLVCAIADKVPKVQPESNATAR